MINLKFTRVCLLLLLFNICNTKINALAATLQPIKNNQANYTPGDSIIDGVYKLVNKNGQCMQVSSTGLVQQNAYKGHPNQQWKIQRVRDGYFKIINYQSNKALEVPTNTVSENVQLQQWTDTDNQKWKIDYLAKGKCKITNKGSGLSITLNQNSSASFAKIVQTPYTADVAHQWILTKITPKQNITVAAYYFPNWGSDAGSEWKAIKAATPIFAGHQQPKVPVWGYTNERDPAAMAQKIDAASANGVGAFIFDWYYWDCGPYLSQALDSGFLHAANNNKIKFGLVWCNHDFGAYCPGKITPATFNKITDLVIQKYFKHPSYLKINGCPYFSIYLVDKFVESFGSISAARAALDQFRAKVKAAGFPDLHVNGIIYAMQRYGTRDAMALGLSLNSTTSYVWIHHSALPNQGPAKYDNDYTLESNKYFNSLNNGGTFNGLETPVKTLPCPYFPNVSMGWDNNPRTWPGGVKTGLMVNNTPAAFANALKRAKQFMTDNPNWEQVLTIDAWNEWGEGGYLEPEQRTGMGYLNAIKAIFPLK